MDAETSMRARPPAECVAAERMVDASTGYIARPPRRPRSKGAKAVLQSHVQLCVTDAIRSGDERRCKRKAEKLVAVLGRHRRNREQIP